MSFELSKVCATVGTVVETEALAVGELIKGQLVAGGLLLLCAGLALGWTSLIGSDANGNGGRPKKK